MSAESATGASSPAVVPTTSSPQDAAPTEAASLPDFRKYKHKVKLEGQESDVDYDDLIKGYQRGTVADKRFQEASKKEKLLAQAIERAKAGDLDWLDDVAGDEVTRKWAEKKLTKWIEFNELSEEGKELVKLKGEKERLERTHKEREEAEKAARYRETAQAASRELDDEISEALKGAAIKPTPRILARMAEYILASLDKEGPRLPAAKALSQVMEDLWSDVGTMAEVFPDEARTRLPKKFLDALRKADVELARSQDPLKRDMRQRVDDTPPAKLTRTKRMSTDDYFTRLEKKFGG